MNKNKEVDLKAIADLIDSVIHNQENSIVGRDALLLRNAVDDLRTTAEVTA